MRKYPKRRRKGPDLDFIGSSTMVLAVLPLWVIAITSSLPFLYLFMTTNDRNWNEIETWWQTNVLLVSILMILIQELILWRGPLGVVNRSALLTSEGNRIVVYFGLKSLILLWSLSLWRGLILGIVDGVLKRNGHDF
ncbi:MAG TPA: hypothetical protein D7H99_05770 [Candidatus Poseidoniales archaeon]|nr:MAG TPA: hypothetical protein D7H99_05770 [Candidatus Poseidoniales archaeon]HII58456.1 hypothetical protein [Candidatus Poseidoniaceae archaeon]